MAWAVAIAYAAVLFFLSSLPGPGTPPVVWGVDKLAHAVLYAGLAFVLAHALRAPPGSRASWRTTAAVILIAAVYGLTDEWHQAVVPGREATVGDWLADCGGATFGAWWYPWWKGRVTCRSR